MLYDIGLTVTYRYDVPSDRGKTLVRLLPTDIARHQSVRSSQLLVDPVPAERHDERDFFGNAMSVLSFSQPLTEVSYRVTAQVERIAEVRGLDLSPTLGSLAGEIAQHRQLGPRAPHHFVSTSPRVSPDAAITEFARSVAGSGETSLHIVERVGQALHEEMRFDATATDVHTSPSDAFANRHGVCQDFSHVMIAALRALGIPAGYVSGFLRTLPPEGQPRLEGADAMHAWVSAWCGTETGWIEYDPTNACLVARDHITVAHGRDYGDVAPVKGVLRTSGNQSSLHAVDVVPVDGTDR